MLNLLSYNFLFSLSIGITFWLIYAKNCYLSYSQALEGLKVSIAWRSAQAEELISPSVLSGCSWFPPFLCHGSCKRHLSLSHCLSQQNVAVLVNPLFLTPTWTSAFYLGKNSALQDMFLHRTSKNISVFSPFHKSSYFPSPSSYHQRGDAL